VTLPPRRPCPRRRQQALLLTGTPLQNNLHELFALLSYLYPDVFTASAPFDAAFDLRTHTVDAAQLEAAHHMLAPLCLRRLKREVELGMPPLVETRIHCPLSLMQTFWYRRLLLRESATLARIEQEVAGKVKVCVCVGGGGGAPGGYGPGAGSPGLQASTTAARLPSPCLNLKQRWREVSAAVGAVQTWLSPPCSTTPTTTPTRS
jgi:hypothetical protein